MLFHVLNIPFMLMFLSCDVASLPLLCCVLFLCMFLCAVHTLLNSVRKYVASVLMFALHGL